MCRESGGEREGKGGTERKRGKRGLEKGGKREGGWRRGREREGEREREKERIGKTWHIPYLYSKML